MRLLFQLKECLHYCPFTGEFVWRTRPLKYFRTARDCSAWNTRWSGQKAGRVGANGYVYLRVFGKDYLAHRIAWYMNSGGWPDQIDHINRVRHDNRIKNLRNVSGLQNHQNMSPYRSNRSGKTGVHWCRTHGKWKAKITLNKQVISLGYYDNKLDAVAARTNYERGICT